MHSTASPGAPGVRSRQLPASASRKLAAFSAPVSTSWRERNCTRFSVSRSRRACARHSSAPARKARASAVLAVSAARRNEAAVVAATSVWSR